MIIYNAEYAIRDKISRNTFAALCFNFVPKSNEIVAGEDKKLDVINYLKSSLYGNDTFWFPAILVTTNWNRNDDVFTPKDTWQARKTPVGKPVDWQHNIGENSPNDHNEIIGVINACAPILPDYTILPDNTDIDSISKFHLAVGCVIWKKYFPTYAEEIIDRLPKNNLFVSMECQFGNFGYALRKENTNDIILLDRNDGSAWLTQFLRAYDGPGSVVLGSDKYIIGRWVKDIIFTGVGCVNKPGNPESIIINPDNLNTTASLANEEFIKICENCVLFIDTKQKSDNMAKDNKETENVKTADETKASCSCSNAENSNAMKDMETKCAELQASIAKLESELKAALDTNAELLSAKEALAKANESVATLTKNLESANAKLNEINRVAVGKERLSQMKSFNAVADEKADFDKLANMSDSEYTNVLTFAKLAYDKTSASIKTDKKDDSNKDDIKASIKELSDAKSDTSDSLVNATNQKNNDVFDEFSKLLVNITQKTK